MKLNELISSFDIFKTNEESELLERLDKPAPYETFAERDQIIIDNLIKKSLVSKVRYGNITLVVPNEQVSS